LRDLIWIKPYARLKTFKLIFHKKHYATA